MEKIELVNATLAGAGVLAAFVAMNHMTRQTSRAIRCAFITTGVGLLGQCLSLLVPTLAAVFGARLLELQHALWAYGWEPAYDTLLFGGVLAIFTGSRRAPAVLPEPWMGRISMGITYSCWAVFFAFLIRVQA